MKKIILFLFIGLIVACSSKDSAPEVSDSGLAGVWLLISSIDDEGEEYIPKEEGACPHETIISETTISARSYYGENCESSSESFALPYTLNGDTMNFELESERESIKIIELTSTTLKIISGDDSYYEIGTYLRQ
ncbi:lipocalin family protein [Thalassobellus suaedae]|uniref:Lipocalin family protein n=1 Tax=Thalassobellus suaedae TaxID=3074124 RepID=A0ABY9XSZ0_9FLAO|nr:lipocalin family protein [Flavobacteriaceae bacterium HL-DH14]